MSAPGADGAQPGGTAPNGQGQGQDPSASQQYSVLGEDAFNDAPEELREHLVNYVKTKVDPALTQRFQESAQFKDTWEPYSQIEGLSDIHPEDMDSLVEFHYTLAAATDPNHPQNQEAIDAFREQWEALGNQFEFFDDEGGEGDDEIGEADVDDEDRPLTRREFEEMMSEREQRQQVDQATQQHVNELNELVGRLELPGEQGDETHQKAVRAVFSLMQPYATDQNLTNEQLVQQAYADYQDIAGTGQEQLVEETEGRQTGTALKGGGADTSPEEVHFGDGSARKAAMARFSQGGR